MAVNVVFCANAAERQTAIDAMQAAGKSAVSFAADDGIVTVSTVSGSGLVQQSDAAAAFVVIGSKSAAQGG